MGCACAGGCCAGWLVRAGTLLVRAAAGGFARAGGCDCAGRFCVCVGLDLGALAFAGAWEGALAGGLDDAPLRDEDEVPREDDEEPREDDEPLDPPISVRITF